MKVEAVYEGGRLQFLKPVALRAARVTVVVEIPDEAVAKSDPYAGLDEKTLAMVAELDAIRNAPPPVVEADDEVSEKIAQRFAAFALRKDI
jgi:predicted DNA-binding antitoxin AbrB/MazE fold protein